MFAAAECCKSLLLEVFQDLLMLLQNFQGLSVDVVDPQVPSVADDADSPIYSALAAAVAGLLELSHFHPTLNCSCFPGRVAEGSLQMVSGYKVQNLAVCCACSSLTALSKLSNTILGQRA